MNRFNSQTRLAALALASTMVLSVIPAQAGLFGGKNNEKRPVRDFLPPVATINPRLDHQALLDAPEDLEPVTLAAVNTPVLQGTPRIQKLEGEINRKGRIVSDEIKTLERLQQEVNEADLEKLWQATVEKNPVIRFSLEKINTPPDLNNAHSSIFLRKTLGALIYGATMAGTMMTGGSGYQDMGTMAVGNALQNIATGANKPVNTLSATEQIQLAGLIDELKARIVQNYLNYKATLEALSESHRITVKNNNLYSKALASGNDLAIMASGAAYYKALAKETELRQKAKLHRLLLERIAGEIAVEELQLAVSFADTEAADGPPEPPVQMGAVAENDPSLETALETTQETSAEDPRPLMPVEPPEMIPDKLKGAE